MITVNRGGKDGQPRRDGGVRLSSLLSLSAGWHLGGSIYPSITRDYRRLEPGDSDHLQEPASPVKRLRFDSVASEEL